MGAESFDFIASAEGRRAGNNVLFKGFIVVADPPGGQEVTST